MKKAIAFLIIFAILLAFQACKESEQKNDIQYALILHGGAGYMRTDKMSKERQELYMKALDTALSEGLNILSEGGSSVDAVESVIRFMEDSPLFNAGKGAVFTHEGKNELDASIMEGKTLNAGAVAGVTDIKNPISAARLVMEKSKHVMMAGQGASEFCNSQGLEQVNPEYFFTQRQYDDLLRILAEEGIDTTSFNKRKMGTVGCVALDTDGNLCAGTSTGGIVNKLYGRIGDSPVIGAGTYANNKTCGISATGQGEYFIRLSIAHDISALVEYEKMSVNEAAHLVIQEKLTQIGGVGGVICLDTSGNYCFEFNTSGMYRAYGNSNGERVVRIFKEIAQD